MPYRLRMTSIGPSRGIILARAIRELLDWPDEAILEMDLTEDGKQLTLRVSDDQTSPVTQRRGRPRGT